MKDGCAAALVGEGTISANSGPQTLPLLLGYYFNSTAFDRAPVVQGLQAQWRDGAGLVCSTNWLISNWLFSSKGLSPRPPIRHSEQVQLRSDLEGQQPAEKSGVQVSGKAPFHGSSIRLQLSAFCQPEFGVDCEECGIWLAQRLVINVRK